MIFHWSSLGTNYGNHVRKTPRVSGLIQNPWSMPSYATMGMPKLTSQGVVQIDPLHSLVVKGVGRGVNQLLILLKVCCLALISSHHLKFSSANDGHISSFATPWLSKLCRHPLTPLIFQSYPFFDRMGAILYDWVRLLEMMH